MLIFINKFKFLVRKMKTEFNTASIEQVINFDQSENCSLPVNIIPGPGEW